MHAGGAIFVDSGSQSNITSSFFSFNTAGQSGGAVSQADSSSVIDSLYVPQQFWSNWGMLLQLHCHVKGRSELLPGWA